MVGTRLRLSLLNADSACWATSIHDKQRVESGLGQHGAECRFDSVPSGRTVYEGFAAPQGGLVGGGSQVVIPNVNPTWIVR
jgi:hypothetical protein